MKIYSLTIIIILFPILLFSVVGDVVQTISTPSQHTTGLAFDGEYLWTVDRKTDMIYKLDASTGEVVKSFTAPGYFCTSLAWDGNYLWVSDMDFTNTSTESYSGKVYKIDPETGHTLHTIATPYSDPQGLAWDGQYLWVSDNREDQILCISSEDGTTIHTLTSPSKDPRGLAWDGRYLWVCDRDKDEIYRVHPQSGAVIMILKSPGPYPWGLAWGENALWHADYQTDKITRLNLNDDTPYVRTKERLADIELTQEVMNFGPGTVTEMNVYLAEPRNRETQEILDILYPEPPDAFYTDRYGQRVAHFKITGLQPGDKTSPLMRVKAKIWDVTWHIFPEKIGSLKDIPKEIKKKYLQDDVKYSLTHPVMQKAVQEAVGYVKNPYYIARNIFDYLRLRLFYKRVGGWDIAPTILQRGNGSCSEYAFVYIALCRAAGLPARYVGSVVVRGEDACFDFVYHRWVEVYLPNYGWVPVDPSGGDKDSPRDQTMYFGHLANRFLITTEGGGDSEYLSWDYNTYETWEADGPVQLRMEKLGEWDLME